MGGVRKQKKVKREKDGEVGKIFTLFLYMELTGGSVKDLCSLSQVFSVIFFFLSFFVGEPLQLLV